MTRYECGHCGLLTLEDTEPGQTPPGLICGDCGGHVARCHGRR